jgi:hypothetical protein
MKQAIVVCSWSGGEEFTNHCLKSLKRTDYPIIVVINDANSSRQEWVDALQEIYHVLPIFENKYEMGAIKAIYEQTDIEEFWLVQNTIEVFDTRVFPLAFSYTGKSISYAYNQFENYLGKYVRSTLDKVEIPDTPSKHDALYQEFAFHIKYCEAESPDGLIGCIDPTFYTNNPDNYITPIFGEKRFVEIGEYLRKYRSLDPRYYQNVDIEKIRQLDGLEDWNPLVASFVVKGPEDE